MIEIVVRAAESVAITHGGDAQSIWAAASAREITGRVREFHGAGPKISSIAPSIIRVVHGVPAVLDGENAVDSKGLDPDFEPSLREIARLPGSAKILDSNGTEHRADVSRYREWVARGGQAGCGQAGSPGLVVQGVGTSRPDEAKEHLVDENAAPRRTVLDPC
jgi:hypothetical protein